MRRRRARTLAVAGAAALAAAFALDAGGALDRVEAQTVDARFALRGERAPPRAVVLVAVDERTLAGRRRWPFARDVQARLIARLHEAGARLIVYDIALSEPSDDEAADVAVFEAISRARPVLLAATESDSEGRTPVLGGEPNQRAAGAVVGSSLLPLDGDGSVRRLDPEVGGVPALAVQAARIVRGPAPPREAVWIDFAGEPGAITARSWRDVERGRVAPGSLRGRIVVVGATARRLQDRHRTSAGGDSMPGPEIQANAIDTLLRGAPLRSAAGAVEPLSITLLALLVPLLALRLGLSALVAAPVALAGLGGAAQFAFERGDVIAVADPAAALVLGAAATTVGLALTEVRDRRRLKATFARFVPPEVVDALADEAAGSDGLPGTELDATVMFCDLRGFTTYAEGRPPAEVIGTLNSYLGGVSEAVLGHGGTVVAFLGDGVMSVFGAPVAAADHADRALAAAREIAGPRLRELNQARPGEQPFRLGVGLHSGPVMSGTVGSARRMEYAAIGDTTNVAARVQALTKEHGTSILMTSATRERLSGHDGLREVAEVQIRGRSEPARLFAAEPA